MSDDSRVAPQPTERSRFHGAKLALFLGDDLVVILRDERPDIPWPGHWDFPGGGREGLESPEDCVRRELREELGLDLFPDDLVWSRAYPRDGHVFWFFVARMPVDRMRDIVFGAEGQSWRLMSAADYLAHAHGIPQFQNRLRDYLTESC